MTLLTDPEIETLASEEFDGGITVGDLAACTAEGHYADGIKRGLCHAWAAQSAAVDTLAWLRRNGCADFADAVGVAREGEGPVSAVMADMSTYDRLTMFD